MAHRGRVRGTTGRGLPRPLWGCVLALLICAFPTGRVLAEEIDLKIHWIEPAWVPAATGGTVQVNGLGFDGTITASVDGVVLPTSSITVVSPTELQLDLPASGSAQISKLELTRTLGPSNIQTAAKHGGIFYTGGTWYVSPTGSDSNNGTSPGSPKLTVAAGISAAMGTVTSDPNPPAQILVAEGTYTENIRLLKGTVLLGGYSSNFTQRDPDTFISILDGGRNNLSAARTTGGIDNFCLLDGFTLTNSRRTGAGGGFRSYVGAPTLTNNVFIGNVASKRGGGIYFRFADFAINYDASATIASNLIVGNRTRELEGGGAMLYGYYYTNQGPIDIAVSENYIVGNRAVGRGGGVAIGTPVYYTQDRLTVSVDHNQFHFNEADEGGALGASASLTSQLFIQVHNNLMANNTAHRFGGAVFLTGSGGGELLVTSSTLVGNTAPDGAGLYRAAPSRSSAQFTALIDDILWQNTGGDLSDVQGFVGVHFTDSTDDLTSRGGGNFSLDPMFMPGPLGIFYLDPASPALDTGSELAEARGLSERTTQVSQDPDVGVLDLGFHAPIIPINPGVTPQLLHMVPAYGNFEGQDWVLLRGSEFEPGAQVTFDGFDAVRTFHVATNRLLAEPPPRALEGDFTLVDVQIINPGGQASPQVLPYRYVDAEPPEWDSTFGVIDAESPQESTIAVIVRWNPALDAVSRPATYNVHRVENLSASSQLLIPQASNRIASGLTGTSYLDTDFANNDGGTSWVYRVRALDAAFFPNEEMTLVRVFGTSLDGANAPRPDPAVYLLGPREATSGDTLDLQLLVSNQGSALSSAMALDVVLPQDLIYQAGSTCLLPFGASDCLDAAAVTVTDDTVGTPFPLDTPGYTISGLAHSSSTGLAFQVVANSSGALASWVGTVSTVEVEIRSDNNRSERLINILPQPGLQVDVEATKTGPLTAITGSDLGYSVRVTNNGSEPAENVALTDTLSAELAYVPGSTLRDGAPIPDDATGTPFPLDEGGLAIGTLAGSAFTVIEFTATLGAASGDVTNTATATTSSSDENPGNDTSQAITQIITSDLEVIATAPVEALEGSTFELSFTVTNIGDAAADSVVISDSLPPEVSYVAGSTLIDGSPIADDATGTPFPLDAGGLNIGTLGPAAGSTATFSVLATTGTGTATHTASASTVTPEATLANNSDSAGTTLRFVDLDVTATAPVEALEGSTFELSFTVTNIGDAAADAVNISDSLPPEVSYVAGSTLIDGSPIADDATGTPFPLDEGGLELGTLGPASGTTATFGVLATAGSGTATHTALASTVTPETVLGNNSDSAGTSLLFVDIGLSKTAPASVPPGATIDTTLSVSNGGSGTATDVLITDTLPAEVAYVAGSTQLDGAPVADDGTGTPFPLDEGGLGIGSLGPGAASAVTFSTTAPVTEASLLNSASASTSSPDVTPGNDTDTATTEVVTDSADLFLVKSAPDSATTGEELEYTLDVGVTAGSTTLAVGVVVLDTLPSDVTYVADSTILDGGSPVPDDTVGSTVFPLDEGGLAIGDIAPGGSRRVQFRVQIDLGFGTLINVATAASSSVDPDPGNNSSQVGTTVAAGGPLGPVGETLRWSSSDTLEWDVASGASSFFVYRSATASDFTTGGATSLTPSGLAALTYSETTEPAPGEVLHYRVTAGDGQDETDELHMADLAVQKLAPASALRSSFLTYTIEVRNIGAREGTSAVLTDLLPPDASYEPQTTMRDGVPVPDDSAGSTVFPLDEAGLEIGPRPGGSLTTLTFAVFVSGPGPSLMNSASISTSTPEHTSSNNTDGATSSVSPAEADLSMSKSAPASVAGRDVFTYTLTVTNNGPSTATAVTVIDTLPPEVTYQTNSTTLNGAAVSDDPGGAGSKFPLDDLGLDIGSLDPGATATLTFNVKAPNAGPTVVNQATVSGSELDPDLSNNSDTVSTDVL